MKKVIRKGMFETNSSSQHVICVTKNDYHITEKDFHEDGIDREYFSPDEDNHEIYFWDIEKGYGREYEVLVSFIDKLQYAICDYFGRYYGDEPECQEMLDMFNGLVNEVIPGSYINFGHHTKELDIYVDKDGNEILHRDLHYDGWENGKATYYYLDKDGNKQTPTMLTEEIIEVPNIGYIDHQSAGLLINFLKDEGISLKEFLTNRKYIIVVDGDEYLIFNTMINAGLINMDNIEKIYDKSGENVEYQEWLKEQENEESDT